MTTHAIRWTYDDGRVKAEAVCNAAPDADCLLQPANYAECQCESWGAIERDPDGTIWHLVGEEYGDSGARHRVTPGDECNVCLFINESGYADELTPDGEQHEFVIAETPFEPVWENDGCSWRPIGGAS